MRMHNPPHLGEILREMYLEPLDLTSKTAAEELGLTRKALSALLNGHTDISQDVAIVSPRRSRKRTSDSGSTSTSIRYLAGEQRLPY